MEWQGVVNVVDQRYLVLPLSGYHLTIYSKCSCDGFEGQEEHFHQYSADISSLDDYITVL